jgi:hypothetical protein
VSTAPDSQSTRSRLGSSMTGFVRVIIQAVRRQRKLRSTWNSPIRVEIRQWGGLDFCGGHNHELIRQAQFFQNEDNLYGKCWLKSLSVVIWSWICTFHGFGPANSLGPSQSALCSVYSPASEQDSCDHAPAIHTRMGCISVIVGIDFGRY